MHLLNAWDTDVQIRVVNWQQAGHTQIWANQFVLVWLHTSPLLRGFQEISVSGSK
jgi:hypothetical protein